MLRDRSITSKEGIRIRISYICSIYTVYTQELHKPCIHLAMRTYTTTCVSSWPGNCRSHHWERRDQKGGGHGSGGEAGEGAVWWSSLALPQLASATELTCVGRSCTHGGARETRLGPCQPLHAGAGVQGRIVACGCGGGE
jgi:hypothetical protein